MEPQPVGTEVKRLLGVVTTDAVLALIYDTESYDTILCMSAYNQAPLISMEVLPILEVHCAA